MQILFVHPNYPAQFGPFLDWIAPREDVECVFVTQNASGRRGAVRCIPYKPRGGATRATHFCSRTFENAVWNCHAVHDACRDASNLRPDLIVGHSGFGTTAMLPDLYDCPIVNLFEFFYRSRGSDIDFRPEFPPRDIDRLRARMRNAMVLLDLHSCTAGYTPTPWQKSLIPSAYASRIEVLHDGIDTRLWKRIERDRVIAGEAIPKDIRIVTYVSRGLEAMRGFDIFVRLARRIAAERPGVLFVVVGRDRVYYGGDLRYIEGRSFKDHVLREERPDLSTFRFLGWVPPADLARILSMSDLHVYLTAPFVLSWSLLNALACECTVLASSTAPVLDVIQDGVTGMLADFFDIEGLARRALEVLADPVAYRPLGRTGRALVVERYDTGVTSPRLWSFFRKVAGGTTPAVIPGG